MKGLRSSDDLTRMRAGHHKRRGVAGQHDAEVPIVVFRRQGFNERNDALNPAFQGIVQQLRIGVPLGHGVRELLRTAGILDTSG